MQNTPQNVGRWSVGTQFRFKGTRSPVPIRSLREQRQADLNRSGRGYGINISSWFKLSRSRLSSLPPSRMSTPPLDGSSNWRRGELPRGDGGRRLWDHSPSKSSEEGGSPSRAVALFPARPALHSAFPIVESADSPGEADDAKVWSCLVLHLCLKADDCLQADDESSERSTLDWSQDSLPPSSGPHTPSAQRLTATSRGLFDWKPTMKQFSEKLRREQNHIKFFDEVSHTWPGSSCVFNIT